MQGNEAERVSFGNESTAEEQPYDLGQPIVGQRGAAGKPGQEGLSWLALVMTGRLGGQPLGLQDLLLFVLD